MTPEGSLDLPRTLPEFRAERLGIALGGLAAELIDERCKVAELRREIAELEIAACVSHVAPARQRVVSTCSGRIGARFMPFGR